MLKGQYFLLLGGVGLLIAFSLMPTRVVDNKKEQVSEEVAMENEKHVALSEDVLRDVESWKTEFYQAKQASSKADALAKLLKVYVESNRFDSAAKYAELYASEYPSLQSNLKAGDLYYEAFSFAMTPKKTQATGEKARQFYEAVLAEKPDTLNLKVKIGRTMISQDNPMKGIRMILAVLEEDPTNKAALFNLGLLAIQSNQLDKAESRFTRLVELYPDDAEALFYLGVIYFESKRTEEGSKLFARIEENSENEAILQAVRKYKDSMKK